MESGCTVSFAGLCLIASCAYVQPAPPRGQYSVSFKVVAGKLAVNRDAFDVPPTLVKFEPQIRRTVQQAIAKIGPLSPSLLINAAWPDYAEAFENWAAANPGQMDLGTLFSADFIFADVLKQLPDSGLVLNDEDIDPLGGTISFSVLPLFDTNTISIDLPAMPESLRGRREAELRKRLAHLNGSLWCSACIRTALAPMYANLGLAPQMLLLPRSQTIQIIEGPRIASIALPADQVPARDIDRLLWELLDTRRFRIAMRTKQTWMPKRIVDLDRDLGYAAGDEPYEIPYQIQQLQLLLSSLGYTLTVTPSTRVGTSQYVDLRVQSASNGKTKKPSRHVGAGFGYKPGQGFSALGNFQWQSLSLSAGGPSGVLGSGTYLAQYLGYSASLDAQTSVERNRVLDHVRVNQSSTAEAATFEWQPWRGLDGNSVELDLRAAHTVVFNENLNTIKPGVQFAHNNLTSDHPWRMTIEPRIWIDARFADFIVTANTHRSFDHWEYDVSARFENAFGNPPIFELPSFGGASTVRGFRADDAIGRRLWSTQPELWHGLPRWPMLKLAAFTDTGGAYQTTGSDPGLRFGPGVGLRLDLRVAVLKFDWAYGFGQAATGGSRGKFYFSIALNTPH